MAFLIGHYSFLIGQNIDRGHVPFLIGHYSFLNGHYSFLIGQNIDIEGHYSMAIHP